MNIGQAIYSKLRGTATITAYTSNRIYPLVAAQGAKHPCIIYSVVSVTPHHAMTADAKIYSPRVQISCWSTSYSQGQGLLKAVENSFKDFGNTVVRTGGAGTTGMYIHRSFLQNQGEMVEFDAQGKDITYHMFQQYIVWHTSTT